jgi:nicotinamide mononucleotide (NMN) deamidase PncC
LIPSKWQEVARAIHDSGRQMVIAVTGGGSGALGALLQTSGASRSILEAVVPYSFAALVDWIGGKPDQACSEATARAMAMAAFMRARELAADVDVEKLIGIGCTASLATDRPKRGERRIHVAFQTADRTESYALLLADERPTRQQDEQVATNLLLWVIARACDIEASALYDRLPTGSRQEHFTVAQRKVGEQLSGLLLGRFPYLALNPVCVVGDPNEAVVEPTAILSGAFNPLHSGHRRMAAIAEDVLQRPVAWELSIANVDKPPLDYITLLERVDALQAEKEGRVIAVTRSPTFREKAELFPGATFVVGADTMLRIAEPRYYGGDEARRDEAIAEISRHGSRFLVFGRVIDGRFMTLGDLNLPAELLSLCDEVPASEFREDVSSTELRSKEDI